MTKEKFYEDIRKHIANIYSFPTKAKVTKIYTDKKKYYVDVKEIKIDGSVSDVILPKVELPKMWGAEKAGVFCMPSKDSIVRVNFEKGNKNFPYVESVLGSDFDVEHAEKTFILVYDTTVLKIEDKKITVKIGDDTSVIIEDKKLTGKIKDVQIIADGSADTLKMQNKAGCKIEVGTSSIKMNDWEVKL
jgi:hypothetical protein